MSPESKIYRFLFNHIAQIKWQWRVLIFLFFLLVLSNFVSAFYTVFLPVLPLTAVDHDFRSLIQFTGWLIGISFLTWAMLRVLDKRPWRSIGLSLHPEWKRELIFGLLLGALMPVVLLMLLLPWGFVSVSTQPIDFLNFVVGLSVNILIWAAAAIWIELALRGYFLQTMAEGMGKIVAAIFVSLMYALLQSQFHTDQIVYGVNLALLGFVFSICYFRTRALWTGIGVQFALNFIQNFVFGTPVYGIHSSYSLFNVDVSLRNIAVGDYFSIEQGLIAALITISCIYYLLQSKQLTISETVRKIKFEALSQPFLKLKR